MKDMRVYIDIHVSLASMCTKFMESEISSSEISFNSEVSFISFISSGLLVSFYLVYLVFLSLISFQSLLSLVYIYRCMAHWYMNDKMDMSCGQLSIFLQHLTCYFFNFYKYVNIFIHN